MAKHRPKVAAGNSRPAVHRIAHGAVVIAAITSLHQHVEPVSVMVAAGLLAKKAVEQGLDGAKPYVKTSLAPGSQGGDATTWRKRTCWSRWKQLGFNVVGYGCTTCIGNSGPLPDADREGRDREQIWSRPRCSAATATSKAASIRSRAPTTWPRRRWWWRTRWPAPWTSISRREPLGTGKDGKPVYLRDIWPTQKEIADAIARAACSRSMFAHASTATCSTATRAGTRSRWARATLLPVGREAARTSTSRRSSRDSSHRPRADRRHPRRARAGHAGRLGDHRPHLAGRRHRARTSPAGAYLEERGIEKRDFNSMARAAATTGDDARHVRQHPPEEPARSRAARATSPCTSRAASRCRSTTRRSATRRPARRCVVLAGKEYGTGSSRDWAAKGTLLLGVRAVMAESFERIHRTISSAWACCRCQYEPGRPPRASVSPGARRSTSTASPAS